MSDSSSRSLAARIDEVSNAVLTPFALEPVFDPPAASRGPRLSRSDHSVPTSHHVYGAVYESGQLVRASLREPYPDVAPNDPEMSPVSKLAPARLDGTWLYGGHWMGHFGHFLLESLSALWPDPSLGVDGLIFHHWPAHRLDQPALAWQYDLVRRAGWRAPIRLVSGEAVCVEHLLLPARAYRLHHGALPEAVSLWKRMSTDVPLGDPVFLSRSRLANDVRRPPGDDVLDAAMAAAGYRVVHPQELSISEQLRIVGAAPSIVGVSGSQLHLSIFGARSQRIIEIGDLRCTDEGIGDQHLMAAARAQAYHFARLVLTKGQRDIGATMGLLRNVDR